MSLASHVLDDFSPGASLHPTHASPFMVHGLPAGIYGGRETSFNVSFGEAMKAFVDEDRAPTVASLVQTEGDERQNQEITEESDVFTVPVRDLIVTDIAPPDSTGDAVIDQIIKARRLDAPEGAVEEELLEVRDEDDAEALGSIDNLAGDSDFMDVGFGHSFAFTDQVVD
jgi:hypothetical protein